METDMGSIYLTASKVQQLQSQHHGSSMKQQLVQVKYKLEIFVGGRRGRY